VFTGLGAFCGVRITFSFQLRSESFGFPGLIGAFLTFFVF
jgi:hypothetical protein